MSKAKWLVVVAVACMALAAVVAAVWAAGQAAAPEVVRAQRFELVDAGGVQRAALGVDADGKSFLALYDEKGKERAGVRVTPEGTALTLFDEKGNPRTGLWDTGLMFLDEKGNATWSTPTGVARSGALPGKTTAAAGWVEVASWSGKATRNTDTFTVRSPWKIMWDARGDYFAISVHSADGELVGMAANVQGNDRDESVQHKGGTFYLDITALGQYEVKVLERR